MSFLRVEKKKSGTYLRILQSYRDEKGKSTHRTLYNLGKVEDYTPEQLRRIGIRLFELGGGEVKALLKGEIEELGRYNYGYQQIISKALSHYGLDHLLGRLQRKSRIQFSLYDALMLMLVERLQDPCSKRQNYHHQREYINLPKVELHQIYRSLDKLAEHNELIQKQIYQTGRDLFNTKLDVVFYDVTTFYFQSEVEHPEALRQLGFGKDGKIGKTQVLFSMMIDKDKNPIGYQVFNGKTYEGNTFKNALETLKSRYNIDKVVIVADRGMLSKSNIDLTQENEYEFILGERLKSLPIKVQEQLLDKTKYLHEWVYVDNRDEKILVKYMTIEYAGKTIISTYSDKRARKDKHEREVKIEKANKLLKNPSRLKNKSRRFFIKSTDEDTYELDIDKIKKAEKYDGLIAISTNSILSPIEALEQYKQLYKIEHSFRTFKSHLEIRPMFHWTDSRIHGHICMCYIAYTLQNWVLNKVNSKQKILTEKKLREILDKMQLSLVQSESKQAYIRSKPQELEIKLQKSLGLKQLPPMMDPEKLKIT